MTKKAKEVGGYIKYYYYYYIYHMEHSKQFQVLRLKTKQKYNIYNHIILQWFKYHRHPRLRLRRQIYEVSRRFGLVSGLC